MSEFSHLIAADAIGRTGPLSLTADEGERIAIAARLDLVALDLFRVSATLDPETGGARLTGSVEAKLTQSCAATGLPIGTAMTSDFVLRYLSALGLPDEADVEVELDNDDCDVLPLEPGGIDVGEAAVQTLALALDLFPRHPDADRILRDKGVLNEDQAGPFAALAALRRS